MNSRLFTKAPVANKEYNLADNDRLIDLINNGFTRSINISAEVSAKDDHGRQVYIGKININNRIVLAGVLTVLNAETFEIISTKNHPLADVTLKTIRDKGIPFSFHQNDSDEVTAEIFGRLYHGKNIMIRGDEVAVDGALENRVGRTL